MHLDLPRLRVLFQITAKVFACTLCAVESSLILVVYFAIEVSVMCSIKAARGDFHYWIQMEDGFARNFVSCMIRLVCKLIMDFTGKAQREAKR